MGVTELVLASAVVLIQFLTCPAQTKIGEVAPEACSYTFQVTGTQLSRYCASVPSTPHHQVAALMQRVNAMAAENDRLQAEFTKLKEKCDGNSEGIKNVLQETEAWRQIIRWPHSEDNVNPGDIAKILDKETEYRDCWHVYKSGNTKKGIYKLRPNGALQSFMAFCDEGWTLIQRRFNGNTSFNRNWDDYSMGFGDLSGEFWLGNDKIHDLTLQDDTQLYFEGVTWSGKRYHATYQNFKVGDEMSDYVFKVGKIVSGNYRDVLANLNGLKFSTYDHDNDQWYRGNCARHYRTGWWMTNCGRSPNHQYCRGNTCMSWGERNVRKTLMKIRSMEAA